MILDVEITLRCPGSRARLSPRAMAQFPIMVNMGLINPRWRTYIELLKNDSIHQTGVTPDTKTRTLDAAADRAKQGDNSSSAQVDHDPMYLTRFGDDSTKPPALPCRDDALVNKGAQAPKSCLSRGDAHTNSCRWPNAHWYSLYNDEDHLC